MRLVDDTPGERGKRLRERGRRQREQRQPQDGEEALHLSPWC